MQKFLRVILIFALFVSAVFPAFADEPEFEILPPSQEFLKWQAERENNARVRKLKTSPSDSESDSEFYGGYIPIPVDLSYLADNPPIEIDESDSDLSPRLRRTKTTTLPSTYDLRELNLVTSVKNQYQHGTCWAFASLGSMESSMLKNYNQTFDLSEYHLAWFAFRNSDKSKKFHNYDSDTNAELLSEGGNAFYSTALFARLAGPVNESDLPYDSNKTSPKTPDKTTPEEYTRVLRLRDVFYLAHDNDNINTSAETRNIIKQRIMENGSVLVSYTNNNNSYKKTDANGTAFFYNSSNAVNHAVQIVGWNDNYPATAFSTNPGMNGAWLIKNSWGNQWGSNGVNVGDDGYFWMSYKQRLVDGSVFVAEPADPNMKVYYYDALGWVATRSGGSTLENVYSANIFKSERNEKLIEVGFYTPDNNLDYEISIYKGLTSVEDESPLTENLMSTTSGTIPYAGYHTVTLNTEVELSEGDVFSVVLKLNTNMIPIENVNSSWSPHAIIETGSLISSNNKRWVRNIDVATNKFNVCIKAFTVPSNTKTAPKITSSYPPDAIVNQEYSFTPTASGTHPITWSMTGNIPAGLAIDSSTGKFSGIPTTVGSYNITLTATNSVNSDSQNYTMNVKDISITPTEITGYVGFKVNQKLTLAGGTVKTWKIASGTLPKGLSLNKNSGAITGTPSVATTETKVTFTAVTATEEFSQAVKFVINPKVTAPAFKTTKLNDGEVSKSYSQEIILSGSETITLTVEGLPAGISFNSSTKTLSGTPTTAGTYTLKFTATNTATELTGKPVTKSLKLKINDVAPAIVSQTLSDAVMGVEYNSVQFTLSAGTGTITWSASGLPSGLKLSTTGLLSGTPTKAGNFKITLKAKNSKTTASLVIPLKVWQKPTISTTKLSDATTDKKYTAKITVKGTAPMSWDISGLPSTLSYTVDRSTTIATITGTPIKDEILSVDIKVTNSADNAEVILPLKVKGVSPTITASLPAAKANVDYKNGKITVKGTKPITITYSISDTDKAKFGITDLSDLGMTFTTDPDNGTATITGKSEISIKNLPITFTATNSVKSVSKKVNFTIAGTKPTINAQSSYSYTVGSSVEIPLTVTGTKNISITMPTANGLSLTQNDNFNATITGTAPNQVKKFTLRVTASNADGKVTKSITIQTVKAATSNSKSEPTVEETPLIEIKDNDSELEEILPEVRNESSIPEITIGEERNIESLGQNAKDKISQLESEGYKIAAILPEISVAESGLYELEIDLDLLASDDKTSELKLFWFAFPKDVEDSEDDEIIEFYDIDGNEIQTVPDNHEIAISAWFDEEIIYEPIIAVK